MTTQPATRLAAPTLSVLGDQRGQVSAVAVMSAAAFACLLLLVINTGSATSRKIELQNAADATAISSATWVARGLNLVSMNNVTQTQILAIVLVIRALDDALPYAIMTLEAQRVGCSALLAGAPLCVAIISAQIQVLQFARSAVQSIGRPLARTNGPLWRAMLALELVSDGVVNGFLVVAAAEGNRVARQNEADLGLVVPAGLHLTLPLRKSAMRPDLCDPTRRGSPSSSRRGYAPLLDYAVGQGPFELYSQELAQGFLPVENSLIRVFFALARESHYVSLCGGSGIAPAPPGRSVDSLDQCRRLGGGTAHWTVIEYRTGPFDAPQRGIGSQRGDGRLAGSSRKAFPPLARSCAWTPPGTAVGRGHFRATREIVEGLPGSSETSARRYRYHITEYLFLAASVDSGGTQRPATPLPSSTASPNNPDPYILSADAVNDLRYLAVVYRSDDERAAPALFRSPLGPHRLAYAQAAVYNPTAFDTFTQDWRARLEPASLIEDGSFIEALGSPLFDDMLPPDSQALTRFRESAGLFAELRRHANVISNFNNH